MIHTVFTKMNKEDKYTDVKNVFQLHSGLAEVAAAKARMFVNKPDGSIAHVFNHYFCYCYLIFTK